ncbi:octopamine receptor-like [Actinia tenebrosa]|uniref:Octopamine receptor-like n=1 Tax=Actinia tenebrosa TaxID=6105 RepID=A0A6P8HF96_ACTTE|nr:octopamine receptor-like [Actinia tenebrosa]
MSSDSVNATTGLDSCSERTSGSFAVQTGFLLIILVITLVGNFTVCITVFISQSLHSFTNYIVASLAVSDLMVGSLSLPFRIHQTLHNTKWCLGEGACQFWVCIDLFCCCASIGNLALISVDRFLATMYPLTYQDLLSKTTKIAMISIVWLYSIIVASSGLVNWTIPNQPVVFIDDGCFKKDKYFYTFASCLGFFLPLTIIIIAYSYVFKVAIGHWRAIRRLTVPALPAIGLNTTSNQRIALTREIKAAKTLAIVVGAFVVCWAPFFIILMAKFWCLTCFQDYGDATKRGLIMFANITFVYTLPNINSTLNPFIYVIFSKKLRQAFVRFFEVLSSKIRGTGAVRPRENSSVSELGVQNAFSRMYGKYGETQDTKQAGKQRTGDQRPGVSET